MKLKMYEVFKERIVTVSDKAFYTVLVCLVVCLFAWIFTDEYTLPTSLFVPPKKITAGENLQKYNRQQVTCEIPYVINHVVDFYRDDLYDEGDENIQFYTHGYVGVDENFENPFFFFVPPERKEEVDEMLEKTWKIVYDGAPEEDIGTLEVTGYVRVSKEKHMRFYENALLEVYGDTELLHDMGYKAYVLDDQNVSFGKDRVFVMYIKLAIFLVILLRTISVFCKVMGYQNRRYVKKYLNRYRLNEFEMNQEFIAAKEITDNYWIGRNYTFWISGNIPFIVTNKEIVLVYATNSGFNFYTLDRKRYSIKKSDWEIQHMLDYYEMNFPHVVVGMDEEIHRMIMTDFDAFLELKYRKN